MLSLARKREWHRKKRGFQFALQLPQNSIEKYLLSLKGCRCRRRTLSRSPTPTISIFSYSIKIIEINEINQATICSSFQSIVTRLTDWLTYFHSLSLSYSLSHSPCVCVYIFFGNIFNVNHTRCEINVQANSIMIIMIISIHSTNQPTISFVLFRFISFNSLSICLSIYCVFVLRLKFRAQNGGFFDYFDANRVCSPFAVSFLRLTMNLLILSLLWFAISI